MQGRGRYKAGVTQMGVMKGREGWHKAGVIGGTQSRGMVHGRGDTS